jgi:hypothetical protein
MEWVNGVIFVEQKLGKTNHGWLGYIDGLTCVELACSHGYDGTGCARMACDWCP